jgi:ligand-binding sensor domain-containing protein
MASIVHKEFIKGYVRIASEDFSGMPVAAAHWGLDRLGPGLGLQQFVQGAWKPFIASDLNGSGLQVSAWLLDRENALWVGTTDQGLYRVYDGGVDRFRSADGLSSNSVNRFSEDREGNLWVAGSGGIDTFRDTRVVGFSTREGLSANQVGAVLASRGDTIWVGMTVLWIGPGPERVFHSGRERLTTAQSHIAA